jgi:hypothetical protein
MSKRGHCAVHGREFWTYDINTGEFRCFSEGEHFKNA